MNKYGKTMYNRLERVKLRLVDIFGWTGTTHWTADFQNAKIVELCKSPDYRRLGGYERGVIEGMRISSQAWLYQDKTDWRVFARGRWWSEGEIDADKSFRYSECIFGMGAHFFVGTDYIYTVPEAFRSKFPVPERLSAIECLAVLSAEDIEKALEVPAN